MAEDNKQEPGEDLLVEVPLNGTTEEPNKNSTSDTSASDAISEKKDEKRKKPTTGRDLGVWEKSLEDRAGLFSVWTLSYLSPLLQLGSQKVLDADDIGVPSDRDRAERAYTAVINAWNEEATKAAIQNEKIQKAYQDKLAKCKTEGERTKLGEPPEPLDPSMTMALVRAFGGWKIFLATVYYLAGALLSFVPVLMLSRLVQFFETGASFSTYHQFPSPWGMVAIMGVVPIVISLLQTRNISIMAHCSVFIRTAVSTVLYRKSLRVSAAGRAKTSTGQVVNMMSNDTAQLQRFLQFFGMIACAPVQIILALGLIYREVGNATWVGVGFMVFLAPVNMVVFSIVSSQRRKVMKFSDLRVKMMNEILSGIRIIKFYAWERPFANEVQKIRKTEVEALTKLAYTSAIGFSLILLSAPLIQPILVFLTYVYTQDSPLSVSKAFTTVALFNIMRFPFAFLPMGILQYIQAKIAVKRLERYLSLPELGKYVENVPPPDAAPDSEEAKEGSIVIRDGTFSWSDPDAKPIREVNEQQKPKKNRRQSSRKSSKSESVASDLEMSSSVRTAGSQSSRAPSVTLRNISCSIPPGSLVAVVGEVGSGKSSFLSAILGDMEPIGGSKVYVPRANAQGNEHTGAAESHADGFVSYCSQTPWIVNDTLRGNVLFGREYDESRYEIVLEACALVDDIAVLPAGEMTEIGERGINLSGGQKARVSLARAFYSHDAKIILLDDPLSAVDAHVGEHIFSRAIDGDLGQGVTRILVTHQVHLLPRCDWVIVLSGGTIRHQGKYRDLIARGVEFAGAVDVSKAHNAGESEAEDKKDKSTEMVSPDQISDEKKAAMKKSGKKLISDEEREEGHVAGSAYVHYAKAGGWIIVMLGLTVSIIGRASELMSGFWLAYWSDQSLSAAMSGHPHSVGTTSEYLGIYALLGMGGVFCLTLRSLVIARHRLRASCKLHDDLTEGVLRAPVAFFDVTPIGRVLNRFAADMDKIDLELTQTVSQVIGTTLNILGSIAGIIAATKGTLLAPLVPISYAYFVIQGWFRKTSTELQRITSIANSPIFADFSQTLSGTSTIRAYGKEQRFFEKCVNSFDTMNASYVLVQLASSWLGLRLDVLGSLLSTFIAAVAVGTASTNFIPVGWLGLALSYSIDVTSYLKLGVKMMATLEADMNSVERVLFYTEKITPEADEYVPEKDPPSGTWPSAGDIEFKNVSMRYRDGPLVLKNISLQVKGGQRVGVAGRTGSGKSSLMVSLFRISEIEADGGMIVIDGVNIRELGISTVRSNISIIPQDPVVFSNTVRYNLDPFSRVSDQEIWETLGKVKMNEVVELLPLGLEEQVAEGGENFSQGQRQLLCIARSLLRKPKILVMDEATASIDNSTDAAIQKMIRENFSGATVLTIAHRLNTIMDSDKVLVLEDGNVGEFDAPQVLLQRENGLFRGLVEKSSVAQEHRE